MATRRWLRWLLTFLVILPVPARAGAPAPSPVMKSADKAFRARDYQRACGLYRQVTEKSPANADAWSSLGLCLHRLDKTANRDAAIAAVWRAIELGRDATRKNAYLNLALIGVDGVNPSLGQCMPVSSATCPDRRIQACRYEVWEGGNGEGAMMTYLGFGPEPPDGGTPLNEMFPDDRAEIAVELDVGQDPGSTPRSCEDRAFECPERAQLKDAAGDHYDRTLAECLKAGKGQDACAQVACEAIVKPGGDAPPAVHAFVAERQREQADCAREVLAAATRGESNRSATYDHCKVLSVEPCRGLIGIACDLPGGKTKVMEKALPARR